MTSLRRRGSSQLSENDRREGLMQMVHMSRLDMASEIAEE